MKYALNLAEDNRILSACKVLPNGNYDGMFLVDVLPEGDIYEYLYVDNKYTHEPLPKPEEPEEQPSTEERIAVLEEENVALKEETAMLTECILELSSIIYA